MHGDWVRFAADSHRAEVEFGLQTDEESVSPELGYGEDRLGERKIRVGQSFFRDTLISAYDGRCCVTGLANPHLLEASHIVPWQEDRAIRLNPRNGLLLSTLHHRAFDAGLMSVEEDFTVLVCESVRDRAEDPFLATALSAYHGLSIKLPEKFRPCQDFLAHHRHCVFQG